MCLRIFGRLSWVGNLARHFSLEACWPTLAPNWPTLRLWPLMGRYNKDRRFTLLLPKSPILHVSRFVLYLCRMYQIRGYFWDCCKENSSCKLLPNGSCHFWALTLCALTVWPPPCPRILFGGPSSGREGCCGPGRRLEPWVRLCAVLCTVLLTFEMWICILSYVLCICSSAWLFV